MGKIILAIAKGEISCEARCRKMWMNFTVFAIFIVLMAAASMAKAERIQAKLIITNELRESLIEADKKKSDANRNYYWNEPNGIADIQLPRINPKKDIAVLLTQKGATPPKPNDVEIINIYAGGAERRVIVTRPGSMIRFKNVDPFDHSLYSTMLPDFKPEYQTTGSFRPLKFEKEGIYEIRCKLVPHFLMYVVVTNATILVPVNGDGTFSVENIGPGEYTLEVFHEGKWIYKQSIDLGNGKSREALLEITLKPTENAKEKPKEESTNSGSNTK